MMMKSSTAKRIGLGLTSLIAGFLLAALVFHDRDGRGDGRSGSPASLHPSAAGSLDDERAGVREEEEAAAVPPMDRARLIAFAKRFEAIEGSPARVEAVLDWFESFNPGDFEPFIQLLFAMMEGEESELLGEDELGVVENLIEWVFGEQEIVGAYFCECWANAAPDSLVGALGWLPPDQAVSIGTYALPYLWARDPEMAAQALEDLRKRHPEEFEDEFEPGQFAFHLYQVSEVAAIRWLAGRQSDEIDLDGLLSNGVSDPHGVIRELFAWPTKELRDEALGTLLEYFEVADPAMALELLQAHAHEFDEDLREEAEEWSAELKASQWVWDDPAARLDINAEDYDGSELLQEWLLRDHESAWAWVMTQGDEPFAYEEFARILGENFDELPFDFAIRFASPSDVSAWSAALSDEQLQALVKKSPQEGIGELYRRDPEAAMQLAAGEDNFLFLGLAEVIEDNETMGRWLAELGAHGRSVLGDQLFGAWAEDDPAAAFEASAEHPAGAPAVVNQWLRYEDPEVIYAAVGARFDEGAEVQHPIIDAWASRDPWTAGETLLADGRGENVPRLIERWVGSDSVEASRFIRENLEPGELRDQAVRELAVGVAARDPDAAREWAESIAGEALRVSVLGELDAAGE